MAPHREFVCSICHARGWGWDNEAWPINLGRCCEYCNWAIVLPERIRRLAQAPQEGPQEPSES
jgi:hypothetical protein